MARTIMHIDLDAFFVSVEQALTPELQGKLVVVGGSPEGRGVIASASYEARAFGLHAGMPLTTACLFVPKPSSSRAASLSIVMLRKDLWLSWLTFRPSSSQ